MKVKSCILLLIFIGVFLLSGCWNYRDLEDIDIVMGVAVDKNQANGDYTLTIEVINPEQAGGQSGQSSSPGGGKSSQEAQKNPKSILVEADGYTIMDAARNAIYKNGKRLFWGHCKGIIISEDIAKEGIIPVLDLFWRDAEIRPDIQIIVSRDTNAGTILKSHVESGDLVSDFLDSTISSGKSVSKFVTDEMTPLIEKLSVKTTSVVTPTVYTINKEGQSVPEVKGTAVFKEDKLKYFLDEKESKTALLIMDQLQGGVLTLNEKSADSPTGTMRIALEIYNSKTKIKPSLQNGSLTIEIEAELEAGIAELEGSKDYLEKDQREILAKDTETMLENRINALISKTQNFYSTDIFGFDGKIKRKMPDYWRTHESDWDMIYKNLKIVSKVKVELTLSAYTSKPITIEK